MEYQDALHQAILDPNQEVSIKVKPNIIPGVGSGSQQRSTGPLTDTGTAPPLGAQLPMPGMTSTGPTPGAAQAGANYRAADAGANVQTITAPGQRLGKNPQLAGTPASIQQDDIYAAAYANARQHANAEYQAVLRNIGFTNESGNFIPGLFETNAARQRAELGFQGGEAARRVNEGGIQGGTFFSGRRANLLGIAAHPTDTALAQLETDLPQQLAGGYDQAGDILRQFGITQQGLLAELAARQAAAAQQRPVGEISPEAQGAGWSGIYPAGAQTVATPGGVAAGSYYGVLSPSNPTQYR